jgi:hypothetical protein
MADAVPCTRLTRCHNSVCSCSDLFGLKHFAANYTTLQVGLPTQHLHA